MAPRYDLSSQGTIVRVPNKAAGVRDGSGPVNEALQQCKVISVRLDASGNVEQFVVPYIGPAGNTLKTKMSFAVVRRPGPKDPVYVIDGEPWSWFAGPAQVSD